VGQNAIEQLSVRVSSTWKQSFIEQNGRLNMRMKRGSSRSNDDRGGLRSLCMSSSLQEAAHSQCFHSLSRRWGLRKERPVESARIHAPGNKFPGHHTSNAEDITHRKEITRSRSRTVEDFNGNGEASRSCAPGLNQNFAFENEAPDFSKRDFHTTQ
jgi:hypothetical protein